MIAAFILVFVKSVEARSSARAEAFRRRYEVNTKALLEP
jgi:hypothetical protein